MPDLPAGQPGGRPPTLRDVCKLAEVSLGTASRVLNPVATRDNTSPETAARVRAAAERLGYRVNAAARGIRGGSMGAVLWLQGGGLRPYGRWAGLQRFSTALEASGQHVVFCPLPDGGLDPEHLPKPFRQSLADGAVLCLGYDLAPEVEERIRRLRLPWIAVNSRLASDCVIADDEGAALAVTRRLLAHGHRRIAYVDHGHDLVVARPDRRVHHSRRERLAGYRRAMAEAGLPVRAVTGGDHRLGPADEAALLRPLLAAADRPSAVVTQSLPSALGAVAAELGLRIPADLSHASPGLDTSDLEGPVTGMAVDWDEIGAAAARALLARLADPATAVAPVLVPHRDHPGSTIAAPGPP